MRITSVEQRAVRDAAEQAGARKPAHLIPEPLAAAIGARIPIGTARGNMVVNIGGGRTEAAVISLYGLVVSQSVRMAGDRLDGWRLGPIDLHLAGEPPAAERAVTGRSPLQTGVAIALSTGIRGWLEAEDARDAAGDEGEADRILTRLHTLEEENGDMRHRLEQGREGVDRLLAKIRFLENHE